MGLITLHLKLVPIVHQIHNEVRLLSDLLALINSTVLVLERLQVCHRLGPRHLYLAHHIKITIFQQKFYEAQTFQDSSIFEGRCFQLENEMIDYLDAIGPMRGIRQQ